MANKYLRNPPISLIKQKIALNSNYKDSECDIDKKGNKLVWCGTIKPTEFSKEYTVLITYKLNQSPKVWVVGNALEKLDAKDFPHKYEIDIEKKMVRICLYRYSEFSSSKLLANTIIPWTIEWLFYYELWLSTGEWLGGGEHPSVGQPKTDD